MSENWDALVQDDYELVMPLPWKKKFGISYLYQPAFTQQLGIFSNSLLDSNTTESFLREAFSNFYFAEINLNFGNKYEKATREKCNLILSLNRPFEEIEKNFRKDFVKKIILSDLIYEPSDDFEKAILLFEKNNSEKIALSKNSYERFSQLCYLVKKKSSLIVRKVTTSAGKLLSIAILFKDRKRIYYILSTTSEEGRKEQANYFLLYHLIKESSGQDLIFDFEGSEIDSIKYFFKKFGAVEQTYPFIKINNLPFLQKRIKNCVDYFKKAWS
jgi:hypothetical protein